MLGWNLIYTALSLIATWKNALGFEPLSVIVENFISFKYNGFMWFFVPLITLYLSMPFLTVFVLNAKRDLLKQFLLVSLCLGFLSPLHADFSVRSETLDIYLFGTRFLVYAVAGFYFGSFEVSRPTRLFFYRLAWLSVVLILFGTAFLQIFYPSHYKYFIQYTNIPCTLLSYAVFVYFKYTDWEQVLKKFSLTPSFLAKASSLSLGIYLIQYMGFLVLDHINPFKGNMLVLFLEMYLGSICVVSLMKRIPILKKIV